MVAVAALALAGTANALWPVDQVAAVSGASKFLVGQQLNGRAFVQCNGLSPVSNACATGFLEDQCEGEFQCMPVITGTLGYTGTISAIIDGLDCHQLFTRSACLPGGTRSIWDTCSYVAGTTDAGVLHVQLAGCQQGANAWSEGHGVYDLWPAPGTNMFTLRGVASLPLGVPAQPLGPWTVQVVH
jgi:hypothetical protein